MSQSNGHGIHMVDIILPSWNNITYLAQCINSILGHTLSLGVCRIIVVNNGAPETKNYITKHPFLTVLEAGKNLGWEGGLKLGLEHSKAPYVIFMNDDTNVPYASNLWILRMLQNFKDPKVAAVGPMSNCVSGFQNIFFDQNAGHFSPEAPFLIGYCVMLDRKKLDEVGGVDDTLPGGDDFDLSIRFQKAGYKLIIDRNVFIFHHGFKSGERLRGSGDKPGGWNSREMTDKTNHALIEKHGFKTWINCHFGQQKSPKAPLLSRENETETVKKYIAGGSVLELGCGGVKTVSHSVGVDQCAKGETVPIYTGEDSVADIVADVSGDLSEITDRYDNLIARHILEHMVDPIACLETWATKVKDSGRLIIVVPDDSKTASIPIDPTHRHGFVPSSLLRVAKAAGLKHVETNTDYDGISFCSVFEKGAPIA